jgi:hypothetical protein
LPSKSLEPITGQSLKKRKLTEHVLDFLPCVEKYIILQSTQDKANGFGTQAVLIVLQYTTKKAVHLLIIYAFTKHGKTWAFDDIDINSLKDILQRKLCILSTSLANASELMLLQGPLTSSNHRPESLSRIVGGDLFSCLDILIGCEDDLAFLGEASGGIRSTIVVDS